MTQGNDPAGPYAILVVDDDPATAGLVRSWYRGQPIEILEAGSGEAAVGIAASRELDLILLDLRMPGMDGIDVARRLKADPATRAIPVILLTACRDLDSKVEAFAAGADDYVTKPFQFEEVDARIRSMLRRRELFVKLESTIRNLETRNQEVEKLLLIDEKTGLYNFRHFQRKLREEWQRAERYGGPLSLILLDLDDFKSINDRHGHPAGDRALREFATLVAGGARATDTAARYGGEEFAIILPHTDGPMAARVAERIRAAVEQFEFLTGESPSRFTVSAGVATYPSSAEVASADALIRAADGALYEAKRRGKNHVVVGESQARTPAGAGDRTGGSRRRARAKARPTSTPTTES